MYMKSVLLCKQSPYILWFIILIIIHIPHYNKSKIVHLLHLIPFWIHLTIFYGTRICSKNRQTIPLYTLSLFEFWHLFWKKNIKLKFTTHNHLFMRCNTSFQICVCGHIFFSLLTLEKEIKERSIMYMNFELDGDA